MKNPLKKLRTTVKKKLGILPKEARDDTPLYRELQVIWPDGTWKDNKLRVGGVATSQMDDLVRGAILDAWANENFLKAQALVDYDLNPGMFGGGVSEIPKGWLPSETVLKQLWARHNWSVPLLHYMVGQLTHLKHIRP